MHFDEHWARPLIECLLDLSVNLGGRADVSRIVPISLRAAGLWGAEAKLKGSRSTPYKVRLELRSIHGESHVHGRCNCPLGGDCPHEYVAAIALAALAREKGSRMFSNPSGDLVNHLVREPLPPSTQIGGFGKWFDEATAPQRPWWIDYIEHGDPPRREKLMAEAIHRRFPHMGRMWEYWEAARRLVAVDNPILALRAYETEVREIGRRFRFDPLPAPPDLAEFLESDRARKAFDTIQEKIVRARLSEWLSPVEPCDPKEAARVDVEWHLAPPPPGSVLPRLCFEVLLSTARLVRAPRPVYAMEQFVREISSGKRKLHPENLEFFDWMHRSGMLNAYHHVGDRNTWIRLRNPNDWVVPWLHSGYVDWGDERGKVRHDPRPAHLTAATPPDSDRPVWTVEFPRPGGGVELVPLEKTTVFADESAAGGGRVLPRLFVLRDATFRTLATGGMPLGVFESILVAPRVPVEFLRQGPFGGNLARRLLSDLGPDEKRGAHDLVREIPARPAVRFRYDPPAATVMVSLRAAAADGVEFARDFAGVWSPRAKTDDAPKAAEPAPLDRIEAPPADAPAEPTDVPAPPPEEQLRRAISTIPRIADTLPVEQWLADVAFHPEAHPVRLGADEWTAWPVKGKRIGALCEAWAKRPPGADYYGDAEFRRLVTVRGRPRFSVKVQPHGVNFLDVSLEMEDDLRSIGLDEIARALSGSEGDLVAMPTGVYRREDLEAVREAARTLGEFGLNWGSGEQKLHVMQLAGARGAELLDKAEETGEILNLVGEARELVRKFKGIPKSKIEAKTASFLRDYQREGADFLVWSSKTFGGALLADDMGLGKTLQVLAGLTALAREGDGRRSSLVVCPASVAHNWRREAEKFAPDMKVAVVEKGAGRKSILSKATDFDILVTNYALARRDREALSAVEWLAVVVDEAQAIKNAAADISKTVKAFDAKFRIALTGTPIENRLSDLESIMEFAAPGYLGESLEIDRRADPQTQAEAFRVARARLRPVLVRRTKAEVAPELPERIEERRDCEMTPKQKTVYLAELKKTRMLLEGLGQGDVVGQGRIQMLAALTRLRQICCDPALLGLEGGSGKTDELFSLVDEIVAEGHKVLVFSQFVRMIERLEPQFEKRGIPFRTLTGQTQRRQELVEAFEADKTPGAFLISLKAGGTGLNLVSASHVVLFDPWWNPAVEAQAIDRAHRIGQDKTVVAFRLVTAGTIEERILELQETKRSLVRNLLEEDAFNRTLSKEDFKFLLEG